MKPDKPDRALYWFGVGSTILGMGIAGAGMALAEGAAEELLIGGGVIIAAGVIAATIGAGRGSSGAGSETGSAGGETGSAGGETGSAGSETGSAGGEGAGSETGSAGGEGAPCFAAGTLVTLGDGSRKAIETVHVGDLVLSQREDGGALRAQRVSHIWEHTVQRTLLLNFSNGEQLETTKEHRICVEGGGFVSAGRLRPGAALNTPANNVVLRDAKERSATTQVYNLEVENFHTYFVGDNLVWVHNKKEESGSEGEGHE